MKEFPTKNWEMTNTGRLSAKVRTPMIDFKMRCFMLFLDLPGSVETHLG